MNFFLPEYRDPLFGIIVFVGTLLLVAILSYFWGVFWKKQGQKSIENFVKKFENSKVIDEVYEPLLLNLELGVLITLAQAFAKSGDFDKAISIYLVALKKKGSTEDKEILLVALGKIYFKAGFLKKSSEVFLEALKIHPRNPEALSNLTRIYEQLRMFDEALYTLEALNEQGVYVKDAKAYLSALKLQSTEKNQQILIQNLKNLSKDFPLLARMVLEINLANNIEDYEFLPKFDDCVDLIYNNNKILKFYGNLENCNNKFSVDMLQIARKNGKKAGLSFKYVCKSCKSVYPLFFYRCPNCATLGTVAINSNLIEEKNEESKTF